MFFENVEAFYVVPVFLNIMIEERWLLLICYFKSTGSSHFFCKCILISCGSVLNFLCNSLLIVIFSPGIQKRVPVIWPSWKLDYLLGSRQIQKHSRLLKNWIKSKELKPKMVIRMLLSILIGWVYHLKNLFLVKLGFRSEAKGLRNIFF